MNRTSTASYDNVIFNKFHNIQRPVDTHQYNQPVFEPARHREIRPSKKQYFLGYVPLPICFLVTVVVLVGLLTFLIITVGFESTGTENINLGIEEEEDDDEEVEEQPPMMRIEMKKQEEVKERECAIGKELVDGTCQRVMYHPNPIDDSMMLQTEDPCDNFYMFACGSYVLDNRNVGEDATFSYIYSNNMQHIYNLIDDAPIGSKLETFYSTCINDEMNAVDFSSGLVNQLLNVIQNDLNGIEDLPIVMGQLLQYDIMLPFRFSVELDPVHARRSIPTFIRSGLSTESENVGTSMHKKEIKTRLMYVLDENVDQNVEYILDIEKRLAAQWHDSSNYEEENMNLLEYAQEMKEKRKDLVSYQRLSEIMYPFNVNSFVKSFVGDYRYEVEHWHLDNRQDIWIFTEKYFVALGKLLAEMPVSSWKAYLLHSLVFSTIDPTPNIIPDLYYTYHHGYDPDHSLPWKRPPRFVSSEELAWEREDRCKQVVTAYFPIILDTYFVMENGIDNKVKNQVKVMAEEIRDELSGFLRTRGNNVATQKVEQIEVMAGTPNKWPIDRSDLIITSNSHIENILNIRNYHQNIMIDTMYPNKILHADDLFDDPLYVANAYYQQQLNTILINAGILTMPAFSTAYSDIAQRARLGVFIGHELTHSIDMIGTYFDQTGSYAPWMTNKEQEQYYNRAQCFIDLYTKKTRYNNLHDGEQTLNENIADIMGFRSSYNSLFSNGDYTDDEKRDFFLTYAQTWCSATTKEEEREYINYSVHSTPEMRVNNVVTQHPDFSNLFQCKAQSKKCNVY